jgi:hypothetical protein
LTRLVPSFTSARLKYERALRHRHELEQALLQAHENKADRVKLSGKPTASGSEYIFVVTATVYSGAIEHWGLVLGDFLSNLRSALDHLVWEIVSAVAAPAKPRLIQFPIARSTAELQDNQTFASIPPAFRAPIERFQPFKTSPNDWTPSGDSSIHPLLQLQHLSNRDKHRIVTPLLVAPDQLGIPLPRTDNVTIEVDRLLPLEIGAPVVHLRMGSPIPGMDLSAEFVAEIAVPGGDSLLGMIDDVTWMIGQIIGDSHQASVDEDNRFSSAQLEAESP